MNWRFELTNVTKSEKVTSAGAENLVNLQTTAGIRSVKNTVEPIEGFQSVSGFFVIAHRGASFYAPENTMPAFEKAVEMKADMIEMDVLLTRDKIPIIFHDKKLNRTSNGSGPVNKLFFREIQELDAGSWFRDSFSNTQIPTLQSVLKWAKNKIALNIEIKGNRSGAEIEDSILELINQYDMRNHVVISSFSRHAIKRVKKLSPSTSTALLNWNYSYGTPRVYDLMRRCEADGLNLLSRQMKRPLMELLQKDHIPVWIYTLNDELEMRNAIRRGATGIFTDRPNLLRRVAMDEFL